jgi:hypothetical protein
LDYFGRDQLRELFEIEGTPTVSIYMRTHRRGAAVAAQPLRLRAALDEARRILGTDGQAGAQDVLEPLEPLVGDQDFWRHQADGLALFASRDFDRLYRLPSHLPDLVVVGPTFHTKPLIEFLQAPERFWVLAVTRKQVRMWEGSVTDLTPVNLSVVPTSLQEALGTQVVNDRLNLRSPRGRGSAPVFHGHGAGKDDSKQELEKFFRAVDGGVRELLADEIGPIILAAVDYYHPAAYPGSRTWPTTESKETSPTGTRPGSTRPRGPSPGNQSSGRSISRWICGRPPSAGGRRNRTSRPSPGSP